MKCSMAVGERRTVERERFMDRGERKQREMCLLQRCGGEHGAASDHVSLEKHAEEELITG